MKTSLQLIEEYNQTLDSVDQYMEEMGTLDQTFWDLKRISDDKLQEYFQATIDENKRELKYSKIGFIFILLNAASVAFFIICGIIMLTR